MVFGASCNRGFYPTYGKYSRTMISWSSMVGFTAGRYDFSNITRYCSSDSILFALLVLLVFVCYVFPSAVTCPRSSIVMVGTSSNMGITYTHRLEAYKVGGGPGHNGRWEVTGFEQVIAYPSKKNRPTWGGGTTLSSEISVATKSSSPSSPRLITISIPTTNTTGKTGEKLAGISHGPGRA